MIIRTIGLNSLARLAQFRNSSVGTNDFLPAALEVIQTPPNPLGRKLALAICITAFSGLAWTVVGKVDIVAVANGKFVSHQRTQIVQPFETASVASILVRSGQSVHAGDPLIELDKTASQAERERARGALVMALLDEKRLQAFLANEVSADFSEVAEATGLERQAAQAQLEAQIAGRKGKLLGLQQEAAQKRAERQSLLQTSQKLEKSLPFVVERSDIRSKAAAAGNASVLAKLESQQLVLETQSDLIITQSKVASLDAAVAALEQKISSTAAEIRAQALNDLAKARESESAGREALAKAARRIALQTLRAPIDGKVQQMHVETVGAVVTPAQQLLSIAPENDDLEIAAVLENRDVGFVLAGQSVEIKVDAFPFTRYGLLRGKVVSIDRDAEAAPATQSTVQGTERSADRTDSVEASERLRYTVHIAMESGSLDVDGRPAQLLPGMSVKAEILSGRRRVIDFILAPLREHAHDSFRER